MEVGEVTWSAIHTYCCYHGGMKQVRRLSATG